MSGRLIGESWIAVLPETSQFRPDADQGIRRALGGLDPQVPVGADTTPFLAQVEAAKQAILAGNGGKIELYVGANTTGAQRGIAEMLAEGQLLRERLSKIPITTDDNASILALGKMDQALNDLLTKMGYFRNARTLAPGVLPAFDNELRRVLMDFDKLDVKFSHLGDDFDPGEAVKTLALMRSEVLDVSAGLKAMKIDPDDFEGRAKLSAFQAQVKSLTDMLLDMKADTDTTAARAKIDDLIARTRKWQQSLEKAPEGAAAGASALAGAEDKLSSALGRASRAADQSGEAAKRSGRGWFSLQGAFDNITSIHVPLFASSMKRADDSIGSLDNGILSLIPGLKGLNNSFLFTASGIHLVIEAGIELAAVWGPALIGLTAFGIAAYPIAKNIYTQWTNMKTVVEATGQSLKSQATGLTSMKSGISGVEAAIKPEVLQLWGDFLTLKGSSHFTDVMTQIGGVLDDFGAKLAMALNGKTTQTFLNKASQDIAGIGDGFEQLGRIIGTLMQSVPGYAALLLKLGDAGLKGLADITQAAQPLIAKFLLLHGAIFYLGLASTILLNFGRAAVTAFGEVAAGRDAVEASGKGLSAWGTNLGNAAGALASFGKGLAGNIVLVKNYALEIAGIAKDYDIATAAGTLLSDALEAGPWLPVAAGATLAAAAIGGILYMAFQHTTDSAQKLNAQLEKTIASSSIVTVQGNIAAAVKQTGAALDSYSQKIAVVQKEMANPTYAGSDRGLSVQLRELEAESKESSAALAQYSSQSATAAIRLNSLGKSYGNTASVLELFNLAGVKQGDIATANAGRWALDQQKLAATAAAYGFTGQQVGALGNQLDALNISTGTTAQAVQTLTSAEQNWLSIITSGDTAFTTFEQQQSQLETTLKQGSKSAATYTVKVGGLTEKYSAAGVAMKGTSQGALAARQAFDSQITAAGTLYGSLQTLAAASGNTKTAQMELGNAGKDMVKQLLQVAGGSKEATTEVYALAQLVGYRGKDSFQALAQWVGTTKNAEADLDAEQGKLTASSATLSQAAKNLGNALQNAVTASQAQAILSSEKFTSIQNKLIDALHKSKGSISDTALILAGQYYQSLIAAGYGTDQARQAVDALVGRLNTAPGTITAVNNRLHSLQVEADDARKALYNLSHEDFQVHVSTVFSGPSASAIQTVLGHTVPAHARGGVLGGGGPAGKDSSLFMGAPGEVVVPASHAAKYSAEFKRDGIPGFSAGGTVGSGSGSSAPFSSASQSLSSLLTGNLFGFGENALNPLLNPAEAAVTGPTSTPMTQAQGMNLLTLVQQMVRLLQQSPQALGQVISTANGQGARKAFFATQ